jgi:hypothetical protein
VGRLSWSSTSADEPGVPKQFISRTSAVPFDEGNRGFVEGGHRGVIGVVDRSGSGCMASARLNPVRRALVTLSGSASQFVRVRLMTTG